MISLIIPCFNEEESLPLFYPEATSVLQKMNCDYELIFVNDGSRDVRPTAPFSVPDVQETTVSQDFLS